LTGIKNNDIIKEELSKMSKKRYLYGLDISLKNTGIAIYDLEEHKFVYVGSFNTEKIYATKEYKGLHLNALKMKKITEWFKPIYLEYTPEVVAIERMFSRFPLETQAIAKATGVIQCMVWSKPQELYPPKEVKAHIWHGGASKDDLMKIIKERYPDLEMNNDDESDAVAVAITYLIKHGLIEWEKPAPPEKKKRKTKKKEG